jgi:hypothetical protein
MLNRVRSVVSDGRQRRLIAQTMFWISFYRLGLWLAPYKWAKKWMQSERVADSDRVIGEQSVTEIVRSVRSCSRFVPYASCLTQALAAKRLMHNAGHAAAIKFGVRQGGEAFEAHAWLEVGGKIVLGKQPFHYRYAVLKDSNSVFV